MALAQDLLPVVFNARGLVGEFGLRPYTVSVIHRTWTEDGTGNGTPNDVETPITEANAQPPKVRALNGEEKALLGLSGTVWEIGPITPDFPGGGTTIATLTGPGTTPLPGDEFFYKLVGPEYPTGALFRLHEVKSDKTFGYRVTIKPVGE